MNRISWFDQKKPSADQPADMSPLRLLREWIGERRTHQDTDNAHNFRTHTSGREHSDRSLALCAMKYSRNLDLWIDKAGYETWFKRWYQRIGNALSQHPTQPPLKVYKAPRDENAAILIHLSHKPEYIFIGYPVLGKRICIMEEINLAFTRRPSTLLLKYVTARTILIADSCEILSVTSELVTIK